MDDYTYGGTSLSFFPNASIYKYEPGQIIESEINHSQPTTRAKTFMRKFMMQCAICAALLAILMLINLFGNSFFSNITQRINHEITTDANLSEIFSSDGRLASVWQTARNFFITTPTNEPIAPYTEYPYEQKADGTAPPAVSTDNIEVDPELLEQINNR